MKRTLLAVALIIYGWNGIAFSLPTAREAGLFDSDSTYQNLIYTVRLHIPHGQSTWDDYFPAAGASPLKIGIVADDTCGPKLVMDVFVRKSDTQQWEHTKYSGGLDYFSKGTIDGIRFDIEQTTHSSSTCTFKVYSSETSEPAPISASALLGAIDYAGGFQKEAALEISPSEFVRGLTIEIPTFCSNVSVLEVYTVTEGVLDKAKLLDKAKNYFGVNNGAGSRISKVVVALNGPVGLACQLPVYSH